MGSVRVNQPLVRDLHRPLQPLTEFVLEDSICRCVNGHSLEEDVSSL